MPATADDAGTDGSMTSVVSQLEYAAATAADTLPPLAQETVNAAPPVPSVTRQKSWNWVLAITAAGTAVNPDGVASVIAPRSTTYSKMMSPGNSAVPDHDGLLTVYDVKVVAAPVLAPAVPLSVTAIYRPSGAASGLI
jgi:hypothetical protein